MPDTPPKSTFPAVSDSLIAALRVLFVDQLPDLAISDRELWAKVGEQRVIKFLAAKAKEQATNVLSKT